MATSEDHRWPPPRTTTWPLTLLAWLWGLRPRIVATPDQLVVRNPVSSRRIPWSDVESADPGYSGIVIRRRSGGTVVAMAAQKSNLASWSRNSSTRADEIARTIEARRDHAQL